MPRQKVSLEKGWYVIHTYSGYEDAVAKSLKQRIESLGMDDKIFNIIVPKEKKIKIKGGKRKTVEEKIYPGYILVEMIVADDSWYVVRNTPNVTGFVGAGNTPIPVPAGEVDALKKRMGMQNPQYKIDVKPGDSVKIIDGPFKDFDGRVSEFYLARVKIMFLVNILVRDTPFVLDSIKIKKIKHDANFMKKIKAMVKLQIPGGKATPAPPVGPALAQYGVNISEFCQKFNDATKDKIGFTIPVEINVFEDRSYDFNLKEPLASQLIKKAAGIEKGSGKPNKVKVGKLTDSQVEEVAKKKIKDLNTDDIEQAKKIIKGTAKSMGVTTE